MKEAAEDYETAAKRFSQKNVKKLKFKLRQFASSNNLLARYIVDHATCDDELFDVEDLLDEAAMWQVLNWLWQLQLPVTEPVFKQVLEEIKASDVTQAKITTPGFIVIACDEIKIWEKMKPEQSKAWKGCNLLKLFEALKKEFPPDTSGVVSLFSKKTTNAAETAYKLADEMVASWHHLVICYRMMRLTQKSLRQAHQREQQKKARKGLWSKIKKNMGLVSWEQEEQEIIEYED